jgi:predicted transcriptional regulator
MSHREGVVYRTVPGRVPAEVRAALEEIAEREDRSLSSVVSMACQAYAVARQREMREGNA